MSIVIANGFDLGAKCRNCKHVNAFHVDGHDNEINIPCDKSIGKRNKICNCLDFDPRNNLKYLEDKYNEKNK